MKKLKILLLGTLLLFPFLTSVQTFPLMGNVYSQNCLDTSVVTYYWSKNSLGETIRYWKPKGNELKFIKTTVKKFSVDGDKVSIDSIGDGEKDMLREALELKADGKGFRILYMAYGTDELIKNGTLVMDKTREPAFQNLCEPSSEVAILIKSKLQTLTPTAQASTEKKSPSEKCYLSIQGDQTIDSCDANVIKNSLAGYNRAQLWKFKNSSEIEFVNIFSNGEAKSYAEITGGKGVWEQIRPVIQNYKSNGNLITKEIPVGSGCFITLTVQEKNGYRKELFKSASPSCSSQIISSFKILTENLNSGKDKGYRIIGN